MTACATSAGDRPPAALSPSDVDLGFTATLLIRPGIHFASDQQAILAAKAVCGMLDQGDTLSTAALGIQTMYGLSRSDSNFFVGAATDAYCKDHAPR